MRIRQSMRRTHRRGRADGANWLSFSDLMSSLLLMFILIMFYIMYQYFDMYEINMAEIARQQFDLDQANASLNEKTAKLSLTEQQMIAQQIRLEAAQQELTEAESVLQAQQKELSTAQALLGEKEQEIASQRESLDQLSLQLEAQQKTLNTQQAKLTEQQATMDAQQAKLTEQQATMDEQRLKLEAQQQTLNTQQATLTEAQSTMDEQRLKLEAQQQTLSAQQATMDEQRLKLQAQQQTLSDQQATMYAQQVKLDEQEQALEDQQIQIEQLVGLRTRIISALSEGLRAANISAQVDPGDGSIALESNMLFEFGKSELTEPGKRFIDRFLPVYLNALFSEDYLPYVSEIIIEGHTDSTGDYITNLELSQDRARAVTAYVLDRDYEKITSAQKRQLTKLLSTNGRSESDLVYDANGNEDPDASRRVVFKFRMTDEQMIRQLKNIMEQGD